MKKILATIAVALVHSIAGAQVQQLLSSFERPTTVGIADDGLEPKASHLLIFRFEWATWWDYGMTAIPMDAFVESRSCEREAQRLEAESSGAQPLYLQNDAGKLERAPHFVCTAVATQSEQDWGKYLLARRSEALREHAKSPNLVQ